jgi:FMN phosphatase YigB (HAD superfamily)
MDDVRGVVFDLDLTLCRPDTDHQTAALADAFAAAGVEQFCTLEDLAAVAGDTGEAESDVDFYRRCLDLVADREGVDAPTTAVAEAYDERVDHSTVDPVPGAVATVEYVADRYPTALLTNGAEDTQREKLRAIGLDGAFDVYEFGDPERGIKPDPEPFEDTLAALDVPAENAVNVGDRPRLDVVGAHAVGMYSAWLPPGGTADAETPPEEPTVTLDALADLQQVL